MPTGKPTCPDSVQNCNEVFKSRNRRIDETASDSRETEKIVSGWPQSLHRGAIDILLVIPLTRKFLPEAAAAELRKLVPDLIAINKCPDFIEAKGHYFVIDSPDSDKRALIEYVKML